MKDIALLFPGQGAQYVGMGKEFYNKYDFVKDIFNESSDILGKDIAKLIFDSDEKELTDTKNAQPAIFTVSYAAYKVFTNEVGVEPKILAGHSLGEISALICAGALDFSDGVKIVQKRGELMSEAMKNLNGGMAAVSGISVEAINEVCARVSTLEESVVISNFNSRRQIVISGEKDKVELASDKLEKLGAKVSRVKVSAAFHSPYMKNVGEEFKTELLKYSFQPLKYNIISNVTAEIYGNDTNITDVLSKQIYSPVRWSESIEKIQKMCNYAIELAPKNILKNLITKDMVNLEMNCFEKEKDIESTIGHIYPNFKQCTKNNFIDRALAIAVCTKNNSFDNSEYESGVVKPYNELQKMKEELESNGNDITISEIKKAIDLLKQIFDTKKSSVSLQKERFNQLITETKLRNILKEHVEFKFN
ncbi:hypothetical protein GCM10008904_21330 [Paraclostridium ghonii]|uniref:[acyl-carrier-protein] S-malonyltransferase n=1 Tax=Paraclostridium ghonii TaxID=29358 RepID=A0ABU0N035_9FIRM|nr:ACP S-malonyltransferase [Paeniclostridium ghonii]MDQ0556525.1 [acyl-carrier-protein] S-malonyltransferase [Paeniclostridium ghonii]